MPQWPVKPEWNSLLRLPITKCFLSHLHSTEPQARLSVYLSITPSRLQQLLAKLCYLIQFQFHHQQVIPRQSILNVLSFTEGHQESYALDKISSHISFIESNQVLKNSDLHRMNIEQGLEQKMPTLDLNVSRV